MTLMRCDPESENIIHIQQNHFILESLSIVQEYSLKKEDLKLNYKNKIHDLLSSIKEEHQLLFVFYKKSFGQ